MPEASLSSETDTDDPDEIAARISAFRAAKMQKMTEGGRDNLTPTEADAVIAQMPTIVPTSSRRRRELRQPTSTAPQHTREEIAWQSSHNQLAKAARILDTIRNTLNTLDPTTRQFVAGQLHVITAIMIQNSLPTT